MNILIINAHSSQNKGDAGIILSMIDSLTKNIPGCKIRIKSRFPTIDEKAYGFKTNDAFANVPVDPKVSKIKKMFLALKLLRILNNTVKPSKNTEDYEWADVVVSCGGGFLLSHGFSVALLQHLVQIKVAKDFKKPVVIYSQSIGPFYNKFMQKIASKVLEEVDKIYIRETISKQWLDKIQCSNKSVELVPDSAFCLNAENTPRIEALITKIRNENQGPYFGITVRDWNFPELDNRQESRKRYIQSIVAAVEYIEKEYNAKVLFMPQVLGPNEFNDDRRITKEILSELTNTNAELLDYDLTPRELKYFYSKMDLFVGTRMHSNIFSLANNIPTVAINYEHKTRGIMNMLDLNEYVLEINEITENKIISRIEKCWNNKESLKMHLNEKMPGVINDSEKPAIYVGNILRSS